MTKKSVVGHLIDQLKPKKRSGAVPTVTQCPYCGCSMSQTAHRGHRKGCEQQFRDAPPQPAEFDQDAGGGYNPDHTFPQT
jgi:hypothetical protein